MLIEYKVEASMLDLKFRDGNPTLEEITTLVHNGLQRFRDFWEFTVNKSTSKKAIRFRAANIRDSAAVMWDSGSNSVLFNPDILFRLRGIELSAAHEVGHKLITYNHFTWPDYYDGGPNWSHVMKGGASTTYHGTFSPREVAYGVEKKGFKMNKRPVHPFCREYNRMTPAQKKNNLEKLKNIVLPYGKWHAQLYKWQNVAQD